MSEFRPKSKWSDAEKQAVERAFQNTATAEEFFSALRAEVPNAPDRSIKAYLTHLCRTHRDQASRRTPVYLDLSRANAEEVARESDAVALSPTTGKSWLDEIDTAPAPPVVPPRPAPAPNFVKPDPKATVPRHYRVPVFTQTVFRADDLADTFQVSAVVAKGALDTGLLPSHGGEIRREVFMALHEAMSDGLLFHAACEAVRHKFAEIPIVSAEHLYAPEAPPTAAVTGAEPDPNKVREGYIPNPPLPIGKNREAPTLDDPNSDAMDAFTVEEAAAALGLTDTGILLTAINRDGFPAVKIDGKWCITRADLKRVRAVRESGLTTEEALKRAGAPVPPITVPSETSWTDHVAPLTTEEKGEADGTPDVMDRDPVWEMVSLEELASELHIHVASVYQGVSDHPLVRKHGDDLGVPRQAFDLIEKKWRKCRSLKEAFDFAAEKLGVLPPPPPTTEEGDARLPDDKAWKRDPALYPMKAHTKAPADEQRQWALEALADGVFTVEQALKIAGVTDTPRNLWALGLLGRGEITLAQAAKLLR